jgi:hypothetical protein
MINAGNTDEAIKTLNCHVDTPDNIFRVISNNYNMAINNKKIELEAENKKKYNNGEKNEEHMKRIKKLETVIRKLELRLQSMKESIYEANDEICPICMNNFEKPTLVDCCGHIYCFNCLTMTLQMRFGTCPICSKHINKNRMHIMSDDEEKKENEKKEKMDALLEILNRNINGKYLIFADYHETFKKIETTLIKHKIKFGILSTSAIKTKKTIDDFSKGLITCIMLNAKNFGAGINLQSATDIILYHRFSKGLEEQIIGRGQRLGRTNKLNVYYLIHDNEQQTFDNDDFIDIDYQQYLENTFSNENDPIQLNQLDKINDLKLDSDDLDSNNSESDEKIKIKKIKKKITKQIKEPIKPVKK